MPRVHVYVTAADRALLENLPPEVTAAHILRQALSRYRGETAACEHLHVRCRDCGADLADLEPGSLEGDGHPMGMPTGRPPEVATT